MCMKAMMLYNLYLFMDILCTYLFFTERCLINICLNFYFALFCLFLNRIPSLLDKGVNKYM